MEGEKNLGKCLRMVEILVAVSGQVLKRGTLGSPIMYACLPSPSEQIWFHILVRVTLCIGSLSNHIYIYIYNFLSFYVQPRGLWYPVLGLQRK